MALTSIDPTTEEVLKSYEELDLDQATSAVDATHEAFQLWRGKSLDERAEVLFRTAKLLETWKSELADLMAGEMGKPITEGQAEIEKCAWVCDFSAKNASVDFAPRAVDTEAKTSQVVFEPLGVIFAIMPWNFPFWQVFRCAAPTLMAGNAVVLKHASNVSGCALIIEELLKKAGLPEGVLRTLIMGGEVANELIGHPKIAAVTLTGSEAAGRAVAARTGRELKKAVLELGGSDAYIVLEDADVEKAAELCVKSRLINAGQSCIAAKRFIVVEPVRERFEELVVEGMRSVEMGDPHLEPTQIGPLARRDLRDELAAQAERSVEAGAKVLLDGGPAKGKGFFFSPMVLTDVRPGMPVFDEETFGPVAAIVPAADREEAIALANQSSFGLGAALFTADEELGEQIATKQLEAGCCFVNDFVRSDPRLPFGGIKKSGFGRELGSFGARELVNVKTVWVAS